MRRLLTLALLPLIFLGSVSYGFAQETASETVILEDETAILENEALPADMIVTEPGQFVESIDSICTACAWPTFGLYAKAGPTFVLGDGFFADDSSVGYQFALGAREPFLPNDRKFFFDFGGAYMSAFGKEDPVLVEGTIDGELLGARPLEDFMQLRLREMSRVGVHGAIGWYWDTSKCQTCNCRFATRFGGRISHVRAHFDAFPTDSLRNEIAASIAAGETFTLRKQRVFEETDISSGIFAGVEMAIDRQLSRSARLSFLIDGEIANDWINLGGYAKNGLPTASLLLGVNLSR